MDKVLGFIAIMVAFASIIWLSPVIAIIAVILALLSINLSRSRFEKFKLSRGNSLAQGAFMIGCAGFVLGIIFLIAFDTMMVTSEFGMEKLLVPGDKVLVSKFGFKGEEIKKDDLAAYRLPLNPSKFFISRCVGYPYDTVTIVDKTLYINGKAYPDFSYVKYTDSRPLPAIVSNRDNFGPYEIPKASYFFLADNRDTAPKDSRNIGAVHERYIVGKPIFILYNLKPVAKPNIFNFFTRIRINRSGNIG